MLPLCLAFVSVPVNRLYIICKKISSLLTLLIPTLFGKRESHWPPHKPQWVFYLSRRTHNNQQVVKSQWECLICSHDGLLNSFDSSRLCSFNQKFKHSAIISQILALISLHINIISLFYIGAILTYQIQGIQIYLMVCLQFKVFKH